MMPWFINSVPRYPTLSPATPGSPRAPIPPGGP